MLENIKKRYEMGFLRKDQIERFAKLGKITIEDMQKILA